MRKWIRLVAAPAFALALALAAVGSNAADDDGKHLPYYVAMDPPIVKMREVIASGEVGRVIQINTWSYKGWLKSARLPSELDSAKGGGVLFRPRHSSSIVMRCTSAERTTAAVHSPSGGIAPISRPPMASDGYAPNPPSGYVASASQPSRNSTMVAAGSTRSAKRAMPLPRLAPVALMRRPPSGPAAPSRRSPPRG